MRDETSSNSKNAMLHYLIAHLDDSYDFSWAVTKASHAVLLCPMDLGEIRDYTQTDFLDRVRRAHAQRHLPSNTQSSTLSVAFKKDRNIKSMPSQKVLVLIQSPMKIKVFYTDTFVQHVFRKW